MTLPPLNATRNLFPDTFELQCPISHDKVTSSDSPHAPWVFYSCSYGAIRIRIWDYAYETLLNKKVTPDWMSEDNKLEFNKLFWSFVYDPKWGMPTEEARQIVDAIGPDASPVSNHLLQDGKFNLDGLHGGEEESVRKAYDRQPQCCQCQGLEHYVSSKAFNACFYRPEPDPSFLKQFREKVSPFQSDFDNFIKIFSSLAGGDWERAVSSFQYCAERVNGFVKPIHILVGSIYVTIKVWKNVFGCAQYLGSKRFATYVLALNEIEALICKIPLYPTLSVLSYVRNFNEYNLRISCVNASVALIQLWGNGSRFTRLLPVIHLTIHLTRHMFLRGYIELLQNRHVPENRERLYTLFLEEIRAAFIIGIVGRL